MSAVVDPPLVGGGGGGWQGDRWEVGFNRWLGPISPPTLHTRTNPPELKEKSNNKNLAHNSFDCFWKTCGKLCWLTRLIPYTHTHTHEPDEMQTIE